MADKLDNPDGQHRDAHRLLQMGALLFLLALLVGFAVPRMAVPRLGLSTHLLGIMQGTFLLVAGLLWPRLSLSPRSSRVGHFLAMYGCAAPWVANLLGAVWGAGSTMLPMAAGAARGSSLQEGAIQVLLVSGALCLVSMALVILWGLRSPRP